MRTKGLTDIQIKKDWVRNLQLEAMSISKQMPIWRDKTNMLPIFLY